MKCPAAVVIAIHAMVGAVSLQAGDALQEHQPLPQGEVTVEEYVPTVLVEVRRWAEADELAVRQAEAEPRTESWVAGWFRRDLGAIFAR